MTSETTEEGPDRRLVLQSSGALLALGALGGCAPAGAVTDEIWQAWQADWRRMEEIVRRRGWTLTPLEIEPPKWRWDFASLGTLKGLKVPRQLDEVLTRYASRVRFGWSTPGHLHPLDLLQGRRPTGSTFADVVWDYDRIVDDAIPNFLNWKVSLKDQSESEAENRPEMWENQFPIGSLANGDMLTIDVTSPDGPQPVRYFSHELEGIHGFAIAPDFVSFVAALSRLGWAGTEQDSWFAFMKPADGDKRYLDPDGEAAREWTAFLESDPAAVGPDEPPVAIVAETAAERALLVAAQAGSIPDVTAALDAGARPDVVRGTDLLLETADWENQFATAFTHAVHRGDVAMMELLAARGATIDTRRLPVGEAIDWSSLETLRWLLVRKARVNGWRGDRHSPLHLLVTRRAEVTAESEAAARKSLIEAGVPRDQIARIIRTPVDRTTYLAMLDGLLDAGADPDAPWDNRTTMLMWGGVETAKRLLAHGADVKARNWSGKTALHIAQTAEKARLLIDHGADLGDLSRPPDPAETSETPLQSQLSVRAWSKDDVVAPLLERGADPKIRDGRGRSTLAYCRTVEDLELIAARGLDPLERNPDGSTLIHGLIAYYGRVRDARALIERLIALGVDVNAQDRDGRTALHVLAERPIEPADVEAMFELGADKSIRDGQGRRAHDLVAPSQAAIRKLLA